MASRDGGKSGKRTKGSYPYWQWINNSGKRKKTKSKEVLQDGDIGDCSKVVQWKEPSYEEGVQLSDQQEHVLNLIRQGKNVFYTGNAGTGKTTLLKQIRKCAPDGTFVTALTGVAAVQAGGVTLHSFAGIGLGNGTKESLCDIVRRGTKAKNWRNAKVLIIDEVSMLDGRLFDKLEYIARQVRNNDLPFGGLQLVMCGDFFQLPPIQKVGETSVNYCFQSKSWSKCLDYSVELTQIYRQSDPKLIKLLYEVRYQCLSDESMELLEYLKRPLHNTGDLEPTKLYSHNARVNDINKAKLIHLAGQEMVYTAQDHGQSPYVENMGKYVIAMDHLVLKIGAQVMLLKNLTEDLINGSRGVVQGFDNDGWPIIQFVDGQLKTIKEVEWNLENSSGQVLAVRTQVPLKLAWAITIHKSQGMSIDLLQVDLKNVFSQGQAYVALSRARTLEGLQVLSFDVTKFTTSDAVIRFYQDKVKPAPTKQSSTGQETSTSNFLIPSFLNSNFRRTPTKRKRSSNEYDEYGNSGHEDFSANSLSERWVSPNTQPENHAANRRQRVKSNTIVDVVASNEGTPLRAFQDTRCSNTGNSSPKTTTCSNTDVNFSYTRVPTSATSQVSYPSSPSFLQSFKGFQKASHVYLSQNQPEQPEYSIKGECASQQFKSSGRVNTNSLGETGHMYEGHKKMDVLDNYQHTDKKEIDSQQLKPSGRTAIGFVCQKDKDLQTVVAPECKATMEKTSSSQSHYPGDDSQQKVDNSNEFDYLFDDNDITDSDCIKASQESQQDSFELFSETFSDSGSGLKESQMDNFEVKNNIELCSVDENTLSEPENKNETNGYTPLKVKRKRRRSTSTSSKSNEPQQSTPNHSLNYTSLCATRSQKSSNGKRIGSSTSKCKLDKKLERLKERGKRKCSLLFEKLKQDAANIKDHDSLATNIETTEVYMASTTTTFNDNSVGVPSTGPLDLQRSQLRSKERSSQLFDSLRDGSECTADSRNGNNSDNVESGCRKTNTHTRRSTRKKLRSDELASNDIKKQPLDSCRTDLTTNLKLENVHTNKGCRKGSKENVSNISSPHTLNESERVKNSSKSRLPQHKKEKQSPNSFLITSLNNKTPQKRICKDIDPVENKSFLGPAQYSPRTTIHSQCSSSNKNQRNFKLQTMPACTQTDWSWCSNNVVHFQLPSVSLVMTDLLQQLFCLMLKVATVLHQLLVAMHIDGGI